MGKKSFKKNVLWIFFVFTATAGLVFLDQFLKAKAASDLKNNDSVTIIRGFFDLTYVENPGAAWGVLSGKMNILVIITIILIPLFAVGMFMIYKNKALLDSSKSKAVSFLQFDMILLLSGAVGNFIDRIVNGYVVDFFQFTFIDFPVFNMADCYITVGAVIFIIIYMFILKDDEMSILFKGKKSKE